jgi:hypothetical protein
LIVSSVPTAHRRKQAQRNWEFARQYAGSKLQKERASFWGAYRAGLQASA